MESGVKGQIGNAIKELRIAKGLSQVELAQVSGVPQQTISAAESGKTVPRVDTLLALSDALGVSPNDIYRSAGLLPENSVEYVASVLGVSAGDVRRILAGEPEGVKMLREAGRPRLRELWQATRDLPDEVFERILAFVLFERQRLEK